MKRIIIMLIMICVCTRIVYGQVEVGVWTEKSTYNYGDTIAITVTAYNPTADTLILQFGSTCQANYIIDDFNFYYHIGCAMVLTARRIPPFRTVSWDYSEISNVCFGLAFTFSRYSLCCRRSHWIYKVRHPCYFCYIRELGVIG